MPLEIPADYKGVMGPLQLGPLASGKRQASAGMRLDSGRSMDKPLNKVISEYENEVALVKIELDEVRQKKESLEKDY